MENKGFVIWCCCSFTARGSFKCCHLGTEVSSRPSLWISSIAYTLEDGSENCELSCFFILIYFAINCASLCLTVYCGDILFCWRLVFIQTTMECYIPLKSVWRRDLKKKSRFVYSSVCPFICHANKKAYSSIIDSRIIIHISG